MINIFSGIIVNAAVTLMTRDLFFCPMLQLWRKSDTLALSLMNP